jgi:hypothetical protein
MKIISRCTILSVLATTLIVVIFLVTRTLREPRPEAPTRMGANTPSARSTSTTAAGHPSLQRNPGAPEVFEKADENVAVTRIADRPRFTSAASSTQKRAGENDAVLQRAERGLSDYRQLFHQNPVGSNAEITSRLLGKNARGTRFLPDNAQVNSQGELIDRWDQPIFFHQISASVMEIRSAGPDRVMWTQDDEVLR